MLQTALILVAALAGAADEPAAEIYRFDLRSQDDPVFARVIRDFGDMRGWYVELDNPLSEGMTRTIARSDVLLHRPARPNEREAHLAEVFDGSGQVPVLSPDGTVTAVPAAEFELARRAEDRAEAMRAALDAEAARQPDPQATGSATGSATATNAAQDAAADPSPTGDGTALAVAGGIALASLLAAGLVLKLLVFA